jgi:hypothetical protein
MPRYLIGEGAQFFLIVESTVPREVIRSALGHLPREVGTPPLPKEMLEQPDAAPESDSEEDGQ